MLLIYPNGWSLLLASTLTPSTSHTSRSHAIDINFTSHLFLVLRVNGDDVTRTQNSVRSRGFQKKGALTPQKHESYFTTGSS